MTEGRRLPAIEDEIDLLVIRGASSTDDLASFGLPLAAQYQRAKHVVLVPDSGPPRSVKGSIGTISFVDADSRVLKVAEILRRIKNEYERTHPESASHAHETVAMFLFFWIDLKTERATFDYLAEGDVEALERCAEVFIAVDFGENIELVGTLSGNGDELSAGSGRATLSSRA